MEYKEFCKQRERMCLSYACKCRICSFGPLSMNECFGVCMAKPKESEQKVEEWVKEHPIVTNADKFKEVFGKTLVNFAITNSNEQGLAIYGLSNLEITEWMEQEYKEPKEGDDGNDR